MQAVSVKVWDLPLRLFHWLLVTAVVIAYLSAKTDWLDSRLHWYAGLGITFLWIFRILWGVAGSTTAQFSQFFPTPRRLWQQRHHGWQGLGHTPTGALSVIALLCLVAAMIATGVFASDDIALQGPLTPYVNETFSDQMSAWHARLFVVLLGLVSLHLLAIAYYHTVKKNNLIRPMITGRKAMPLTVISAVPDRQCALWWRFLCCVLLAALLTWSIFSPAAHSFFNQPSPVNAAPASPAAW